MWLSLGTVLTNTAGRVYDLYLFYDGAPEGSTESGFMVKQGIEQVCDQTFCGFLGYKPVPPGWFKVCVLVFMSGAPKGSPKVVFMEKLGIEPATPGLQGIALIHYTTAASHRTCDPGLQGISNYWVV